MALPTGPTVRTFAQLLEQKKRSREDGEQESKAQEEPPAKRAKTIHEENDAAALVDYTDAQDRARYFPDLHVFDGDGKTHYFHRLYLTEEVSPVLAAALLGEVKAPATLHLTIGTELTRLVLNCLQRGDGPSTLTLAKTCRSEDLAGLITFAFRYDWKVLPRLGQAAMLRASAGPCPFIWKAINEAKGNVRTYATAYLQGALQPVATLPDMPVDFWALCATIPASLSAHIYTTMRCHWYEEKQIQALMPGGLDVDGPTTTAIEYSRRTPGLAYAQLHNVLLGLALGELRVRGGRLRVAEPVYQYVRSAPGDGYHSMRSIRAHLGLPEPTGR